MYGLGQLYALVHVGALHKLEHDVALCRVGIEALIGLLIVFLHRDDGVLALGHVKIVLGAVHTKGVGLKALHLMSHRHGVGVYGYKEVGVVLIGYGSPVVQRYEHIGLACVNHFHVAAVLFYISAEGQCHTEVDVFLLRLGTLCANVVTAMTGVYNKRECFVCATCHGANSHKKKREGHCLP